MIFTLQKTPFGKFHQGQAEEFLQSRLGRRLRGKVQLIMTSPPFPLNKKKSYGNFGGDKYKQWLSAFAPIFSELLTDTGSGLPPKFPTNHK
ncbi:MAG: hypothetical protein ACREPW_04285 [Candidatus Binataceae bacterium]